MFFDNQKEVAYMRNFICPQSKIEPLARQLLSLKLIENQNYIYIVELCINNFCTMYVDKEEQSGENVD